MRRDVYMRTDMRQIDTLQLTRYILHGTEVLYLCRRMGSGKDVYNSYSRIKRRDETQPDILNDKHETYCVKEGRG